REPSFELLRFCSNPFRYRRLCGRFGLTAHYHQSQPKGIPMTNTLSSNRLFAALLVAGTAFGLAACGGKSSTKVEDKVATEDIEVQVTESTVPVLYQAPLEFESGVTELGTSTPTTLTFTANDTNAAT